MVYNLHIFNEYHIDYIRPGLTHIPSLGNDLEHHPIEYGRVLQDLAMHAGAHSLLKHLIVHSHVCRNLHPSYRETTGRQ